MSELISTHCDPTEALAEFCEPFLPGVDVLAGVRAVDGRSMSDAFRRLLVHNDHMTTTLRAYYGAPVALEVREAQLDGEAYRRRIVLRLADGGRIVEVGFVRIRLGYASKNVRERILERRTPLGDILIQADVLRRIEPRWFFEIDQHSPLLKDFDDPSLLRAFGRLGTIFCEDQPAIELLEIVRA